MPFTTRVPVCRDTDRLEDCKDDRKRAGNSAQCRRRPIMACQMLPRTVARSLLYGFHGSAKSMAGFEVPVW